MDDRATIEDLKRQLALATAENAAFRVRDEARDRTEAAQRESEARHRLLTESWAQALWETDAAGVVIADSPSWRAYTGQTLEEWLGYGWLDAIHPDDRAYAERQWREAVAAQGLVDAEFRLRAPDGGWRWTNVRAAPILDRAGRIEKWAGMNIDIDARKRAEAALRESEERYRSLFNAVGQGLAINQLVRDGSGRVIDARYLDLNPAYEAQTGFERHRALGRLASEIFPLIEPFWLKMAERVVATGQAERIERFVADTGRWFAFDMAPFEGADQFVVLYDNITDRKQAEVVLREREERQAFLLKLSDVLRPLSDAIAIQSATTRLLGTHLGVDRAMYAEVEGERGAETGAIRGQYVRPECEGEMPVVPFPGRFTFEAFGRHRMAARYRGELLVVADVDADHAADESERAAWAEARVRAAIVAPLVKEGRLVAEFGVHCAAPRAWTDAETSLVREVAERTWAAAERARAEAALREREGRLAAELSGTQLLQRLSTRLIPEQSPEALHEQILDAALELMGADAVSIQLLDDDGQRLRRLATRNLHVASTEYWTWVDASHASTCGQALRTNTRVVVEDVEASAELAGTGDLEAFRASGTRAVQSTPLVSRSGRPIGMISTHWRKPRRLDEGQFGLFDILARQVADLLERSQTEAALRASEERLRRAISVPKVGVLFFDLAGRMHEANAAFELMCGYTIEELRSTAHWDDLTVPEFREATAHRARELAERGETQPYEKEMIRKDGTRWWGLFAPTRLSGSGPTSECVEFVIDITAAKRAEAALRESEERLRNALSISTVGVLFWDGSDTIADTNEAFLRMTGLSRTEALGLSWRDLTPPEFLDRSAAFVSEVQTTGQGTPYEKQYFRRDGSRWWGLFAARKLGDGFVEFVLDVTDRREIELALRESEERFAQFAASSSDALWMRDAATRSMEFASPAIRAIYGVPPEAILGDPDRWTALIVPEDRESALHHLELARGGEAVTHEFRIRRPTDGEVRWIRNTDFPLFDAHGRVQRIGGIAEDVTEAKHTSRRLEVLVNELQHRARNLLGVVAAVVDRTVKQGGAVEAFEERLQALSRTQGLLSQGGSDTVEVGALVRAELAAHIDAASDRVTLSGPEVHLTARQVQNFALAVHELTTNAVKYGALKGDTGQLAATWEVVLDGRERRQLALSWVETGVVIDPATIARRGYGTELIQEALAYALQATVDYALEPTGVRCRITMPVS